LRKLLAILTMLLLFTSAMAVSTVYAAVVRQPDGQPVGGEIIPVNALQVLAPYMIYAFFVVAAFGSILWYKRRIT